MVDLDQLAHEYGLSADVVGVLDQAVQRGGGRMAQFSHPDLGGMGQWSAGGMTQIGAMSDIALRDRVAAVCAALAGRLVPAARPADRQVDWWPDNLGRPSSAGGQNGVRYASFPDARRVAIERDGQVTLYDSGEHRIGGVSQSQGGSQSLLFTSQIGLVRVEDLPVVT